MGVRGIARWSNAPPTGVRQIEDSVSWQQRARKFGVWSAELKTLRRSLVLPDGTSIGSERLLWEYIGGPENTLVIIEDPTAPKRAEYLVARAEIQQANAAKKEAGAPDSELLQEPMVPRHYRHTLISFRSAMFSSLLDQLAGPWISQPPKPNPSAPSQKGLSGGMIHRLTIRGSMWNVGSDWVVRVGGVFAPGEVFKGVIMEIEYLPVDILPYVEGSSAFLDAFTLSLLPSLPTEANFNSVVIDDQEWAHVCGVDWTAPTPASDDIYVYGDEENVENTQKDDWRRSAYMIVQAFHGEGLLHEQSHETSPKVRPRDEQDSMDDERPMKRIKLDEEVPQEPQQTDVDLTMTIHAGPHGLSTPPGFSFNHENLLPPSRKLLGLPPAPELPPDGFMHRTLEVDVGISQFIGTGLSQINGIIKQRFTDFMVHEIDMTHNIVHLKSLERPTATLVSAPSPTAILVEESTEPWPPAFSEALAPFFSDDELVVLRTMYLEGPKTAPEETDPSTNATSSTVPTSIGTDALPTEFVGGKTSKQKPQGRAKGKPKPKPVEDKRKAVSQPIESKEKRFQLHKVIRDLFKSKLETFTEQAKSDEIGARIIVKWAGSGPNKGSRRAPNERDHQPYIHFTVQKTNRDTSDALSYLARMLKVDGRNLTVAGTKDKRAVTCQRVCLKRGNMTVEDVWDKCNQPGRRTQEEILQERGERGIRVADVDYRKGHLQLGMLKGNEFIITLRNVKAPSVEAIDQSMEVLKTKGFINYYGMQRFGTASVPTHAIGLALLRSEWAKAIDMILRPRPGETPEIQEARLAWAVERDLDKALRLMPRRVVAERCILESFQRARGDTRNVLGALSSIPRNLRTMYVHAYQSYVWNSVVSERIRRYGHEKPIVGDIVYEEKTSDGDQSEVSSPGRALNKKSKNSGKKVPRKVKVLTEEDVGRYTIYDVLMPLPGTDVAYPGGELGELYRQFLKEDGLDPTNFNRKQKEYSLAGSYRKIIHLPTHVEWKTLRYTDPELSLAQSDEDRLLGIEPPQIDELGKFIALQIRLRLGAASYATMALREVTKVDTSTHVQTLLTVTSEDQGYKGAGAEAEDVEEGVEFMDEAGEAEAIGLKDADKSPLE